MSVLGAAWIEFLRGRSDLFVGTWAETKMRKEKLIGVHLDLSDGGQSVGECVMYVLESINKGLALAEKVEGTDRQQSEPGRRKIQHLKPFGINCMTASNSCVQTIKTLRLKTFSSPQGFTLVFCLAKMQATLSNP